MVSPKQKRLLKQQKRKRIERKHLLPTEEITKSDDQFSGIQKIYHDNYKQLFVITTILLLFSLAVIGMTYVKTGDVIYKGVSLSGGLTMTISTGDVPQDIDIIEALLIEKFPEVDIIVREISELGTQSGITLEAATSSGTQDSLMALEKSLKTTLGESIPNIEDRTSTEIIGPSLGQSFFAQVVKAVLIAFAFMGLVVFIYFGDTRMHKLIVFVLTITEGILIWYATGNILITILAVLLGIFLVVMYVKFSIPSAAVILAAISTIIFVIAVVDLMQMRISTAGIAAFLMLIGYSVDTDILLSTRIRGGRKGSWPSPEEGYRRIIPTIKTGLTMEMTTMAATLVALVLTQSPIIREIMLIIFIGLFADIFFTWIQNVGILRWYLERSARR